MSASRKVRGIVNRLLVPLLLVLCLPGLGVAQEFEVERVEWDPWNPDAEDDIIMSFDVRMRSAAPRGNEFVYNVDDRTLLVDLHASLMLDMIENHYSYSHDWGRLDPGNYDVIFTTFVWGNNDRLWRRQEFRFQLEVAEAPVNQEFAVALAEGWNLISAPVAPEENEVPWVFRDLVQAGIVSIVKDGFGRFYSPVDDFNNIPSWNFREGYLVKMVEDDSLIIAGETVEPDTPIPLEDGWNMTAYFPESEVEAPVAFENIIDELIIAKDGEGAFFIPEEDFNNMQPLRRGSGYLVKVSEEVELIWNVP